MISIIGLFWAVISAVLTSFTCVLAERSDRGESLSGRSHCVCGRQLKWSENIPIIGWLKTRGVAKCCNTKIPARYVIAETATFIAGFVAGISLYKNTLYTVVVVVAVQLILYGVLKYISKEKKVDL